jgi:hypothetical protein
LRFYVPGGVMRLATALRARWRKALGAQGAKEMAASG